MSYYRYIINNWCIYMKNLFLGLIFFNLVSYSPPVSSIVKDQPGYNTSSNVRNLGYKGRNVEEIAPLYSIPVQKSISAYSYDSVNDGEGYSSPSLSQVIKDDNNPHLPITSLKNSSQGGILKGEDLSYEHVHEKRLEEDNLDSYYKAVHEKLHPKNKTVKAKEPYHRERLTVSTFKHQSY